MKAAGASGPSLNNEEWPLQKLREGALVAPDRGAKYSGAVGATGAGGSGMSVTSDSVVSTSAAMLAAQ